MTKQQVLDLIAANLATGSNITASEHRAVEEAIVDLIGFQTVAYGRIGPIDIGSATQTTYDVNGNLSSAVQLDRSSKFQLVRVTIPSGLLTSTNFKIRVDVESASSSPNLDNDMLGVLSRKNGSSTNTFDIVLEEITQQTTSIYLHVEVVQL
jgi:hypothetical protein